MAYLIDGSNLIGLIYPHSLKDPKSKYELVSKILIFQRIKKARVILVFDGPPDTSFTDEKFRKKSFKILFPDFEQNADMVIKDIIAKQNDLKNFFVVSSDREIKTYARMKGANTLTCQEFLKELRIILKKHKKYLETKKNVKELSPLEINQWIEIFKAKNE